jgi:hypothetical protein
LIFLEFDLFDIHYARLFRARGRLFSVGEQHVDIHERFGVERTADRVGGRRQNPPQLDSDAVANGGCE